MISIRFGLHKTLQDCSVVYYRIMLLLFPMANILDFIDRREHTKKKTHLNPSICAQPQFLASLILLPTTDPYVLCVRWLISFTYCIFYRLDVLPRSFASGSLIAAAIKPLIEEYTYSVVVFDGKCSGIDVRFFPSQETLTPESQGK